MANAASAAGWAWLHRCDMALTKAQAG